VAVSRSAGANTRGGTAYLGKDVLGSVRSSTSEYGALEERYEYDAFGKPYKGDFGSGMNLGYTGKPYDTVTGLYNYGYRDYQPETARFTTVDPVRDGSNWFAYVNNDPVNWVDPWGLTASDKGFWGTVGDIAGKIVAAPMTAVGLVAGTVVTGISIISGNGGRVSIENNAVTFTTGLNFGGSITLGNTIIHAGGDVNGWNSQTTTGRYDGAGDVNLGKHEEAHTYQYQTFGVLTPAIIVGSAIVNGGLGESNFHDFMAKSAFETAADNYSEIQREQNK
jgi:RHS repeat-associated protein